MLDKRLIAVTDHKNTHVHGIDENDADCHYEWLVKWTGLGYSHATWEVENASFLRSLEAVKLMTNYEIRHQQATKELHPLTEDEVNLISKCQLCDAELEIGEDPFCSTCFWCTLNS